MPSKKVPKTCDDVIRATLAGTKGSNQDHRQRGARTAQKKVKKTSKNLTDLLGPPPLLQDENPAQYFALYEMLRLKLKPRDIVEEIYVRHMMDDAWLVTRYRRMNSHILNMAEPTMGDEWQGKIERYRNAMMGSEDLLDMRNENLILHDFSQYSCVMRPNDLIARQFEKRISEINLIEGMISRCMERMRRSHLTLEDFRDFMQQAMNASMDNACMNNASMNSESTNKAEMFDSEKSKSADETIERGQNEKAD